MIQIDATGLSKGYAFCEYVDMNITDVVSYPIFNSVQCCCYFFFVLIVSIETVKHYAVVSFPYYLFLFINVC